MPGMPIIPALSRLLHKDHELDVSLGSTGVSRAHNEILSQSTMTKLKARSPF
jgi:hypothetical protein